MRVQVQLPTNTPTRFNITNILPFFLSYLRNHFSTTDNRFISYLNDLKYFPTNKLASTIQIELFNNVYYLIGNVPTIYLQLQTEETPKISLTDKVKIDDSSDAGEYVLSEICTVIFSCLAPEIIVCEHIVSEIIYLLFVFAHIFATSKNVHLFQISEITPAQYLSANEQMQIPIYNINIITQIGLTTAWKIDF